VPGGDSPSDCHGPMDPPDSRVHAQREGALRRPLADARTGDAIAAYGYDPSPALACG